MVKKKKKFSDLAIKIFKEHYDFLHEKELHKWKCEQCDNRYESREELEVHRRFKHIKNIIRYRCNNSECEKEFESMEELWEHEYCYILEQCDNGYESREELEDHRRRRHTKYICDQCDNWYESREDLEDHRRRRHSQECEEKLECRKERE